MARKDCKEKEYGYFDKPDGEETFEKLYCVLKPTVPAAVGVGISDVLLWSQPKGYLATGARLAAVSLPIIGIASTFVLATNGFASLRKKDDRLNWFMGGFVAGSCIGLWKRNAMWGFNIGILGGTLAFLRKEAANHGWDIIPKNSRQIRGGATSCLHDYTLTAERPRNWTTGPSS